MSFSLLYGDTFLRCPWIKGSQGLIFHLKWAGRSLLWQSLKDLEASTGLSSGPLWVGAIFSTLLVIQKKQWVSARLTQCRSSHHKAHLCVVDGCVIELECSAVSWFLGQLAEYVAILLFLLSCYFWLKSLIPQFSHFLCLQFQFEGA